MPPDTRYRRPPPQQVNVRLVVKNTSLGGRRRHRVGGLQCRCKPRPLVRERGRKQLPPSPGSAQNTHPYILLVFVRRHVLVTSVIAERRDFILKVERLESHPLFLLGGEREGRPIPLPPAALRRGNSISASPGQFNSPNSHQPRVNHFTACSAVMKVGASLLTWERSAGVRPDRGRLPPGSGAGCGRRQMQTGLIVSASTSH